MAFYLPTIGAPYVVQAFIDNAKWADLLAAGVVQHRPDLEAALAAGGDFIDLPKFDLGGAFARGDRTSTSAAVSYTDGSSTDDKAVVLADVAGDTHLRDDVIRSGANFSANVGATIGERLAIRLLGQLARMTSVAITKVDTPTSNIHVHDVRSANASVASMDTARYKMGDNAEALTTIFLHSRVMKDLIADAYTNFSVDVFGADLMFNGKTRALLGIENFIVSDLATNTGFGSGSTGGDSYDSVLMGPGAIYLAFQSAPEVEEELDTTNVSTKIQIKTRMNYLLHPRGIKWTSTGNPSDANYGSAANWDEGYSDHRNVKLVLYQTSSSIVA